MANLLSGDLFRKLGAAGFSALVAASRLADLRGHRQVDIVHFLHQLTAAQDSDLHRIATHFDVDLARLEQQLTASLDELRTGGGEVESFSPTLRRAVELAWVVSSLYYAQPRIRTGHLILGLLREADLRPYFYGLANELRKIKLDALDEKFERIVAASLEESPGVTDPGKPALAADTGTVAGKDGSALAQFSVDLTARAQAGFIDPVVGRNAEIRQVIDILTRRRQNNPILTGEAGVGKTAVVEGLALRIAAGDVPPSLREVILRSLDVGALQAGAGVKGEFEKRLKQVIDEVQTSPRPVVLFIDEAHTLIGSGGAAGQNDAANLLKPALARGILRTVAATTWAEYKRYIEADAALTRRFQVVKVEEPGEEPARRMVRSVVPALQKHHGVLVLDRAVEAAVRLSKRYLPWRQLPDKAVSLLDTACARVAISQHTTPPAVEDLRRSLELLEVEIDILRGETTLGHDQRQRADELAAQAQTERGRLADLEARWELERQAANELKQARSALAASLPDAPTATECLRLEAKLAALQGETPLVFPHVDESAVAAIVAEWTGIPVGSMVRDEIQQMLQLADALERRVIGQRHALEMIARRVQTSRSRLDNPNRPIGVFLLAGPSGTGKTETALALAETLFGDETHLVTINMSEFQEAHTVSTLKGAPPGYVGYGEGGKLTEAIRRRPYCVLLLDEVEKAHPDVHKLFFQVFDKGWMEDGEGRFVDFKNTLILLTTNAGQDTVKVLCSDPDLYPTPADLEQALRVPLTNVFPDALLNRMVVIPYYPIGTQILRNIITLALEKVRTRVRVNHGIPFSWDEATTELVAQRCSELERGARLVDAVITNTILPEIGREFLTRLAVGKALAAVMLSAANGEFVLTCLP